MKKIIVLLIAVFLLNCKMLTPNEMKRPVCRHKSVLAALVFGEKYPVRIAHGPAIHRDGTIRKNKYHAQAQAYIDHKWEWLEVSNGYVTVGSKDWWFKVTSYVTVEKAMTWSKLNR